MYSAFKINKDFEWGMLETLTSKNGYTNLAKCELKKNDILHICNRNCDNAVWIWKFIYIYKKKVAGENFWLAS